MEGLEALRREYTFKKSTLRLRYSYAIRFLRSLFGISLRAVLVVSLYFNERRRAGVRCAVTDVGEERNQHRGRARPVPCGLAARLPEIFAPALPGSAAKELMLLPRGRLRCRC